MRSELASPLLPIRWNTWLHSWSPPNITVRRSTNPINQPIFSYRWSASHFPKRFGLFTRRRFIKTQTLCFGNSAFATVEFDWDCLRWKWSLHVCRRNLRRYLPIMWICQSWRHVPRIQTTIRLWFVVVKNFLNQFPFLVIVFKLLTHKEISLDGSMFDVFDVHVYESFGIEETRGEFSIWIRACNTLCKRATRDAKGRFLLIGRSDGIFYSPITQSNVTDTSALHR